MQDKHLYKFTKNTEEPLITGFLKNVKSFPDSNALWINDRYHSYEQLYKIVVAIYQTLPTDNIHSTIGIYCNDDVYTYAGILAINLYGASYVPLNNKFPSNRNKSIVEQCKLKLILSSIEHKELKDIAGGTEILLLNNLKTVSGSVLEHNNKIDQPIAYTLFTSGSTGEPKGVPISNSNVNHCLNFFLKNFDLDQNDRFLQVYELTFDVSVFSFFMPLQVGACCYVVPNDGIKYIKIIQMLEEHKITVISMVPGILRYMEQYLDEVKFDHLRYSFFSGDALYHELAVKWKKSMINGQIHNFYGPTETTIVCTHYLWTESQSAQESVNGIVPLGKPFDGMNVLIVDSTNQLTEKGELCFSGSQVITAYLNNSHESQFFIHKGKRYYKTGDTVSYNTNGNIVFHGRMDNQVKVNGYRVELIEIEFAIEKITKKRSVVLCVNDKQINKLIAFIETKEINEQTIKSSLASLLPDYMIPQQFIAIEKIPLNINQKTDKQTLLKFIK
ncbi:MAG: AMP-binding protein [Bacteroidota bacterium]